MKMKRSIAPLWTEAALILLIVGVAVVGVVAYQRSDRPTPLSAWEKEKLSLTRKADALERKNRALRDTVRALEARIAQREDPTGRHANLLAEIEELHKRRNRAQASAQTAEAEVAKTRNALTALDEQLGQERRQLRAMSEAAVRKEAALTKARNALSKQLEDLAEKKTTAAKHAESAAAEVVRVKQALAALETTFGARQAELTVLSEEIAQNRKTLAALDNQIGQKKTHLETTSEAASRKEAALAKDRDSRRQALERLTQQETAVVKRTETARAELVRVKQALSALEITLRERRTELTKVSEETARQKRISVKAIRALTSEFEALKIQRDLIQRQVDSGKSQGERLRQEANALQIKLRAKQSELKSVEDAVRQRKAALDTLPPPPTVQTPVQLTDKRVCLEAWARVAAEPKARARLAKLRGQIAAAETELCELNKQHKAAKEKLKPSASEPNRPRQ